MIYTSYTKRHETELITEEFDFLKKATPSKKGFHAYINKKGNGFELSPEMSNMLLLELRSDYCLKMLSKMVLYNDIGKEVSFEILMVSGVVFKITGNLLGWEEEKYGLPICISEITIVED